MGVILGAAPGAIHKDAPEKNVKVSFTLRSMPDTWADSNGDGLQQKAQEKGQVHQLGAAVVHEREGSDGKALVYGGADLFADEQMGALGNRYLLIDGLNWLADEESFSGTTDQVEDASSPTQPQRRRLIFHGTVFGLPLLVLAGGLTYRAETTLMKLREPNSTGLLLVVSAGLAWWALPNPRRPSKERSQRNDRPVVWRR